MFPVWLQPQPALISYLLFTLIPLTWPGPRHLPFPVSALVQTLPTTLQFSMLLRSHLVDGYPLSGILSFSCAVLPLTTGDFYSSSPIGSILTSRRCDMETKSLPGQDEGIIIQFLFLEVGSSMVHLKEI